MIRNPSPPPEHHTSENVDRIGDSVYSQCWVLSALVSLSSQTKKEDDVISEDEENLWCQLWDMSADQEVGGFMLEKGACDLLLAPLVRSTNYRVREVALGVIGNMLCHSKYAKIISAHTVLLNFIPTMLKEDDVAVLTETMRLIRAALAQDSVNTIWLRVLHDDTVERIIHIMQSTLEMGPMVQMRPVVLSEHCAHLLESLYYYDDKLLVNSAYTVFPIVEVLKHPRCTSLKEPLLRCLQYLSEEPTAVKNMSQCSALPGIIHGVLSEKQDYSLVAVCLSLVCTLLTDTCDDMTAWLEKDGTIVDMAIGTLHRILNDDKVGDDETLRRILNDDKVVDDEKNSKKAEEKKQCDEAEKKECEETENNKEQIDIKQVDTKYLKTDQLAQASPTPPVRLVTPTYGTPIPSPHCPTPQSSTRSTPYSITPYSIQWKGFFTPSARIRRSTSEPPGPILQVCREMCWNFVYTLANNVPTEGSCVLRYISINMTQLIECFSYGNDSHVELAMLYKQHLDKYPYFSSSVNLLTQFITTHVKCLDEVMMKSHDEVT